MYNIVQSQVDTINANYPLNANDESKKPKKSANAVQTTTGSGSKSNKKSSDSNNTKLQREIEELIKIAITYNSTH